MLKGAVTVLYEAHCCKMTKLALLITLIHSGQMCVKCKFINYATNK